MAGLRRQHKVIDLTRSFGTAETLVETRINCAGLLEKVPLSCFCDVLGHSTRLPAEAVPGKNIGFHEFC